MAILDVLKFPDPLLRKKSQLVVEFDEQLESFSKDLLDTMYEYKGIGLAAPQVDKRIRMVAVDTRPREGARYDEGAFTELEKTITQPLILVNPEITEKEGQTTYDEGCLSVPTYFETVKRFDKITIKYLTTDGKEKELQLDGLLSIVVQHEIDHLDGKLFIDRLSTIKSTRIKSKIKNYGYPDDEEEDEEDDS